MISARDNRANDPAYIQWQKDRAAEVAPEQAADPELQFRRMADEQAQATRELILTGYITDEFLPGVDRLNGRKIVNEDAAIRNFKYFADTTPTFKKYMADVFLSAAERSDLAPIAPNYTALHNLMLAYSAYPDEPVEVVHATVEPVRPRSDQAIIDHQRFMEEIVGTDELGTQYTEDMLSRLPAKDELRLRRLFEKGHRGSSLLDTYREIKDIQQQQEADRVRRAAEEGGAQ